MKLRAYRLNTSDLYAAASLCVACVGLVVLGGFSLLPSSPPQEVSSQPSPSSSTQPAPVYRPSQPTNHNYAPLESRSPASTQPISSTTNISSKLLRFSNEDARRSFLTTNHLGDSQLVYLPTLSLYVANYSQPLILPDGTTSLDNQIYSALLTPTDPGYQNQWYLPTINAPSAWNDQTGTAEIVTAVIDTGVARNHEDLSSKWSQNINEIGPTISEGPAPNCTSRGLSLNKNCNNLDDDSDGYIDNYLGWSFIYNSNNVEAGQVGSSGSAAHGTIVSGLIGASANNNKGISGGNWGTKLLPIQVLDDTGSGTTLSVSQGIRYAVDHGAQVINLSLGSSASDQVLSEQIQYAISHGVVVVAAAGNDGCNCMLYPARYSGVVSVGATTQSNVIASFSSYGSVLSLTAPGANICSTTWSSSNTSSAYGCGYNGTSFASPLVASQAALLLSQDRSLTPDQVKTALINGASKLTEMNGLSRTDTYGSGLLNGASSLALISRSAPTGIPVNIHSVSLQTSSPGRGYDALNTVCTALLPAVCQVEATNLATNESLIIGTATDGDLYNLYWSTQSSHLSPGTWKVKIFAVTNTSKSLARSDILTISP